MNENNSLQIGDFAFLEVVSVTSVGAFLDWGHEKDLLLPFAEQIRPLEAGDGVVVKIYEDNTGRPCASMRVERYASKIKPSYTENEAVKLMIAQETEMGFKAIINNEHIGLLYKNEIFQEIYEGDIVDGFTKKLREDGKIDLILRAPGHKATEDIGEKILKLLEENKGFLKINDKTPPEKIYELFGASKKKYKIALGGLYKSKKIKITDDGVELVKTT